MRCFKNSKMTARKQRKRIIRYFVFITSAVRSVSLLKPYTESKLDAGHFIFIYNSMLRGKLSSLVVYADSFFSEIEKIAIIKKQN